MSELASLPLALAAFDNMEEAEKWGHPEPRGCTFDYCKNKTDVRLKMRTGDICPDCNELIKRRGIDPAVAKQVFAIFDEVREQVLFRDRFKIIREPSRLNVNMLRQDLILTDIGNTSIHLAPREMTIYCLFLNHPEGIFFKDMRDHEIEIGKLYRRFSYDTVTATIENRIKNMAENEEDTVSYLINHINKKLRENLGEEIAAYYIIQGGRAENHKITLDRKKVSKTEL
jgi:hypothetical protein